VSAAAPTVPPAYQEQLAEGGRLLIPLGEREEQTLHVMTRRGDTLESRSAGTVRFVPLLGKQSWES
jgi:protein-L-isoaspartate(D-aspartate) O-methyltransferase